MAYELHIVEDTFDDFRRRIAKANAEVNLDALPALQPVSDAPAPTMATPPAEGPQDGAEESPTPAKRTRRTKAEMEAAKAAETAPPADAAPAAEPAQAPAQAPARVVTREQVREAMGQMIARHPNKGAAATQFLQDHAKGAKNISGTADADLPVLLDAVVAWLEANPE